MNQNDELASKIDKLQRALDDSLSDLKALAVQADNAPSEYEEEEIIQEMRDLGERIGESTAIIENIHLLD